MRFKIMFKNQWFSGKILVPIVAALLLFVDLACVSFEPCIIVQLFITSVFLLL